MRRFPLRTLLLMVLALLVFARLWAVTHRERPAPASQEQAPAQAPQAPTAALPSPHCRGLERAVEAAVRAPDSAQASAGALQQLSACEAPPARACELGLALEARAPLAAGDSPLRPLLSGLCERCAPAVNPCGQSAARALRPLALGQGTVDLAALRWSLEHAGPATENVCALLVRSALVPAALSTQALGPAQRSVLEELAPLCARAGALPASVVNAAVAQQGQALPGLARLAVTPAITAGPLKPEEVVGPEAGRLAFDASEATGVPLQATPTARRWEADGALSARFAPPVKQLASLRVRASGPGTLRAIVRTPPEAGLEDPERGFAFVHPTACRFQGSGQWESCALPVPLLDVAAVSVFPDKPLTLQELEVLGAR